LDSGLRGNAVDDFHASLYALKLNGRLHQKTPGFDRISRFVVTRSSRPLAGAAKRGFSRVFSRVLPEFDAMVQEPGSPMRVGGPLEKLHSNRKQRGIPV